LTGFTREFVYSARVVVLGATGPLWFRELLYCASAPECDTYVGVFEETGNFQSHSGALAQYNNSRDQRGPITPKTKTRAEYTNSRVKPVKCRI